MRAWIGVLALFAIGSGCGGGAGDGTCVTSAECGRGEACVGGSCLPASSKKSGCTEDTECQADQYCDFGVCRMKATSQNTTPDAGESPPPPPPPNTCDADTQCNAGDVCENKTCVPGCAQPGSSIVCGTGTTCGPSGRCATNPTTCGDDSACGPPSSICEAGACVAGCTEPGGLSCTGGNVCEATTGRCRAAPMTCSSDALCGAPAAICENSQCVPGCNMPGGAACTGNNVCDNNSGRCMPITGACGDDGACGAPARVCEGGQCVPGCDQVGGLQCSGSSTCNTGTGRCDAAPPPPCSSDAQCNPPATICEASACVPSCQSSGCPTGQNCSNTTGRCENAPPPPMCTVDSFEPNNSAAAAGTIAPNVTHPNLGLCTGDDDFYAFNLAAGDEIEVEVLFTAGEGDIDISLIGPGGTVVASASGVLSREFYSYTVVDPGRHVVRVFLYGDRGTTPGNTYSINATVIGAPPPPMCNADRYEPNDSAAAPASYSPSLQSGLSLCMGNEDFYRLQLQAGDRITVDLRFSDAEGDVDLSLLNQSGAIMASSASTDDDERVTYTVLAPGNYVIRAWLYADAGSNPGNTYTLESSITVVCPVDLLEENDTRAAARSLPRGTHNYLSSCNLDDDYYRVTLTAGQVVTFNVRFPHAEGDIDFQLLDSTGASVASSLSVDDDESITYTVPANGTYYPAVYLYGDAGSRPGNMYTLEAIY